MSRRVSLPGAGFLVLAVGWSFVLGFLVWGLSTPLLDRVWQLTERMQQADFNGLDDDEVRDLEDAVAAHPELGRDILGRRMIRVVEPTTQRWSSLAACSSAAPPPAR